MCYYQKLLILGLILLILYVKIENCKVVNDKCDADYTDYGGICKYYKDCPKLHALRRKTYIVTKYCDESVDPPIICCPQSEAELTSRILLLLKPKHVQKCEEYHQNFNNNNRQLDCANNGRSLIKGGLEATLGEFPHMALIGFNRLSNTMDLNKTKEIEWACGGTLISEEFVLTAAHCSHLSTNDTQAVKVRLGEHDSENLVAGVSRLDINIKKFIPHKDYKVPSIYNDIALIQLDKKVTFTKRIRPACLWSKMNFPVSTTIASGFGANNSWYYKARSGLLQKIEIDIINDCTKNYPKDATFLPQGINKDTMICAKDLLDNKKDTCTGDSGSPIQIYDQINRCIAYAIGVVSHGKTCGGTGIYTRVSHYIEWIENHVWP